MNDIRETLCHRRRCFAELSAVTVPSEAARLWGINLQTLYDWLEAGKIIGTKPDNANHWLVSVRDLKLKLGDPPNLPDSPTFLGDVSEKM